jgi:ABC-type dipeptide/oligopeptide/nickel transport system ATPase component
MTTLLEVRELRVEVTDPVTGAPVEVVRGCSFDLARGEVVALVGESGSGKTIMLRSLLGISDAWPGVVNGTARVLPEGGAPVPLLGVRQRRRALPGLRGGWAAYVFQHPREALDPFQTVGRQVGDSVRIAHPALQGAGLAEKVHEWLAAVVLPDPAAVAQLHPHELSGGMAQRVAIAVALATEPELLVADEPTTGLDWSVRREVLDLLVRLQEDRGMTLLLITHDFAVVRHIADRVLVLFRGELVEDGPRSVFFEPGPGHHPYARELQERVRALEDGRAPPEIVVVAEQAAGCAYRHRCSVQRGDDQALRTRCESSSPALKITEPEHRAACHALETS